VSEYYLTVPAIGLAITLASSLTAAPLPLAAAMLLLLLPVSWLSTWRFTQRARYRTTAWESIMDGVAQIAARHPGKAIYLEGIGTDLFIQGFTDNPFRLIGLSNVKLTPHEAASIDTHGWIASMSPFTVPAEAALHALDSGAAFVFRFEGDRFRHTTPSYRTRLAASELASAAPTRVELGNTMYDYLLGPGWFEPSDGYRWMGRSARATLGGSGRHLHVRGFCAPAQLAAGPLHLAVKARIGARSRQLHDRKLLRILRFRGATARGVERAPPFRTDPRGRPRGRRSARHPGTRSGDRNTGSTLTFRLTHRRFERIPAEVS
jgi:hypothetical protein